MRIYAIVEEQQEPLYVTTLNRREIESMDDDDVAALVRRWCEKRNFTFVEYVN